MNKKELKGKTIHILIQVLYWICYGLMFQFAAKFLQNRSFTTAEIGICIGICYTLSAVLQPMIADLFARMRMPLNMAMLYTYILIGSLGIGVLTLRAGKLVTAINYIAMLTLQSAMQPTANSLHRYYADQDVSVKFSIARGTGSLVYAIVAFLVGNLLSTHSPELLPIMYIAAISLLIVFLYIFKTTSPEMQDKKQQGGTAKLLIRHPLFTVFLLGITALSFAHIYIDNFLLQIFQNIGGDSAQVGTAVAIAAGTEFPAMFAYTKVSKRIGCKPVILIAGWGWVIRHILIFSAKTFTAIYFGFLFQIISFAIYVPASLDYAAESLGVNNFLKGQALVGCAFTAGSLLGTLLGGPLTEAIGIHNSLGVVVLSTIAGAILFSISVLFSRRKENASH